MENLRDRGQAVGGAAGVGDDRLTGVVVGIDAQDIGGGIILGGSGNDDPLRPAADVTLKRFTREKPPGTLQHHVGPFVGETQIGRVAFTKEANRLPLQLQAIPLQPRRMFQRAVNRIKTAEIAKGLRVGQIVDGDQLHIFPRRHDTGHTAADAAKSVDRDL